MRKRQRQRVSAFLLSFQGTDKLESHYPNITKTYTRGGVDQCNYRRYSTEGWPGGTPVIELDDNQIEGAARTKVSRSSSPSAEESLGLSRTSGSSRSTCFTSYLIASLILLLALLNR